jgi:hypothetical protein
MLDARKRLKIFRPDQRPYQVDEQQTGDDTAGREIEHQMRSQSSA